MTKKKEELASTITLRAYFAAAALPLTDEYDNADRRAKEAVSIADALIKALI